MSIHSRPTWGEIVGWMIRFRLDGELLRASASGLLERAGVPFLREVVVVCGNCLADSIVNPARVGFSFMEDRVRQEEEEREG